MRFAATCAALSLLALPFAASAQVATQAELLSRAQELLRQVEALRAQMGLPPDESLSTTGSPVANCPSLSRTLGPGSSGPDVNALQQFLADDPTLYPEGLVTGYYGVLTQAAVQRFQAKYDVVSSGDPQTTGYGLVGPRTLAAIGSQCGGGASAGPVGGFIQVSPVSGVAPLSVTVQATVNTTGSCAASTYTLSFGDGTPAQPITVSAGGCQAGVATVSHTYAVLGTYLVTLSAGSHEASATVYVQ